MSDDPLALVYASTLRKLIRAAAVAEVRPEELAAALIERQVEELLDPGSAGTRALSAAYLAGRARVLGARTRR